MALFDDAVPTTLLRCDGFSSGVYDEIQETVRAHYDRQIPQIDGDAIALASATAQSPPKNHGPRAARLNGFYTYICLRKLRV